MRTGRALASSIALIVGLLAGGCGNGTPTTSTSPSPGAGGVVTTETFSGTLQPNTSTWHAFTASTLGTVSVSLTSIEPAGTVGIGIGTMPTGGCTVQAWNNASTTATTLTAPINAGGYCAAIYDVGRITAPVTYTLTVAHP